MAALVLLVRHDRPADPGLARRSVWLLALAPSAYSLVLGYADGPLLLCSVVALLGRGPGAGGGRRLAGLAGGLVRPVGILLVVPLAHRGLAPARGPGPAPVRRLGPVAAALCPGRRRRACYLAWVDAQFGDPWLPFRVQQQLGHRGALRQPFTSMWHNLASVVHGHHLGSAAHVPWVLLCLVLLVVAFRRLPLSYGGLRRRRAGGLGGQLQPRLLRALRPRGVPAGRGGFDPDRAPRNRSVVLVASALAMVGYALLAFFGMVVP